MQKTINFGLPIATDKELKFFTRQLRRAKKVSTNYSQQLERAKAKVESLTKKLEEQSNTVLIVENLIYEYKGE